MASTIEEQQFWVARLLKRIQKSGYKAAGQVLGFTYPLPLTYIVHPYSFHILTSYLYFFLFFIYPDIHTRVIYIIHLSYL